MSRILVLQRAVMKAGRLVLRDNKGSCHFNSSHSNAVLIGKAKKSRVAANTVMIVAEQPFSAKILIFY